MNNLHRELAPISDAAWAEIEEETSRTIKRYLAGRRVVDVQGPGGIALSAIGTGHLRSVAAPGDGGVHPGAAHLLQRHLLADDHLGHPGRPEVHRGVAVDHDHEVAERRDVRAAGSRRTEQAADLRDLAGQRDLIVEDATCAPTTRSRSTRSRSAT